MAGVHSHAVCLMVMAKKKKPSYLLSPKDICTLTEIPDLIEAGVNSFKIEGRMKKPEYAAFTAWLYRYYADKYLEYGREKFRIDKKIWKNLWIYITGAAFPAVICI